MSNRQQRMLTQLQSLGLINKNMTDRTIATEADDDTPWFLQLFFGFSGFIASLFFIGFLSLMFEWLGILDSFIATFLIGLILSGIGFILFRHKHTQHSTFLTSLTFAISVAGQLYMTFALFDNAIDNPLDVWLFLLIQIVLTVIMPNFIYRLLSTGVVLGCLIYLLNYYHMSEASLGIVALITAVSALQRYELLRYLPVAKRNDAAEVISTVAYASALMLLAVSVYFIAAEYGNGFGYYEGAYYNYTLSQTLLILASLYAAYLILHRYQSKLLSTLGIISVVTILILGALSVYVSGLLATSLVIVIAMANSQRVMLALGIAALVGYIFWYYYQLDTSLLIKSISMFVIGVAILLMRWLLIRFYPARSVTTANISDISHEERPL